MKSAIVWHSMSNLAQRPPLILPDFTTLILMGLLGSSLSYLTPQRVNFNSINGAAQIHIFF